jgi:putative transposase
MRNPLGYYKNSSEINRLVVMLYVCYRLSLRQVEDLLFERGGRLKKHFDDGKK